MSCTPLPVVVSRPYNSVESAKRDRLAADTPQAAKQRGKTAAPQGESAGIQLADRELRGAAAAKAAVARGLAFVPLDKLAVLSPEQLAKRLRSEVEQLVGTEDESPRDPWFVHGLHSADLVCSLVVVILWLRKTYMRSVEHWVCVTEWCLCAFFLTNYMLRLLRAGLAPGAAGSVQSLVDVLTAIPLALQGGPYSTWISFTFLRALCCLWAYEALEASGALDAVSDIRRRMVVVLLRFMALIVCFAGIMFVLEALGDIGSWGDTFISADMGDISFYQMCYYIFVTISTVGYGDFAPKTVLGRAFVGVVITGGVAFFSLETSALVNLAKTEASGRGRYKPRGRRRHVLIAGGAVDAAGATLGELLDELCAPSRGSAESGGSVPDCLIISPGPPGEKLRALLERPGVKRHAHVLAASLLDGRDLVQRCSADKAAAAFVFSDLCSNDPEAQDQEALVMAAALHRACPKLPLLVVLNTASCAALGAAMGLPPHSCFAADALASSMMGVAARVPGAATLLCNFCRAAPPAPPRERHRPWHDQYLHGLATSLHACPLGANIAAGTTFGKLAKHAYHEHSVLLLALSRDGGSKPPVLMPPPDTELHAGDVLWGTAGSALDVHAALSWEAPQGAAAADWRADFHEARRQCSVAAERDTLLRRQARLRDGGQDGDVANAAAACSDEGEFSPKDAVNDLVDAGCHVVIINSGGDAWHRCLGVATSLTRSGLKRNGASIPLVVLSPTAPPRGLLHATGALCVKGTAQDAEAMLRAGVDTAMRVVYLAGSLTAGQADDDGDDVTGGGGALDRRAVLSTNIVERHHEDWQRDVFLLVELRAPASIKYLTESVPRATGGETKAAAAAVTPPLPPVNGTQPAASSTVPGALAARLGPISAQLAGALERTADLRELRHLLNKGLLSGQGALNALLGTELALLSAADAPALPPVRASPALHSRYAAGRAFFATDICRVAAHSFFCPGVVSLLHAIADPGAAQGDDADDSMRGALLWPLPVDDSWIGRTYGSLVEHLQQEHGAVTLGLYRQPPVSQAEALAYVFACAPPWIALQQGDVAYVLVREDSIKNLGAPWTLH